MLGSKREVRDNKAEKPKIKKMHRTYFEAFLVDTFTIVFFVVVVMQVLYKQFKSFYETLPTKAQDSLPGKGEILFCFVLF